MSNSSEEWEDFVAFCADAATCTEEDTVNDNLGAPGIRTLADARGLRDQLERRVAELPEVCRVIIGLYFCKGLGLDQIGTLVEVPRSELEYLFAKTLKVMRGSQMSHQEGINHG